MSKRTNNIKNKILEDEDYIDDIIELMQTDYDETLKEILNALLILMKNNQTKKEQIDYLIEILEFIITKENNLNNIKKLQGYFKNFITRITLYLTDTQKKNSYFTIEYLKKLKNITIKKKNDLLKSSDALILEYLIYQDKNLDRIKNVINIHPQILTIKDELGFNILYRLLNKYANLEEYQTDEINYLYTVIVLFINSKNQESIIKDKDYYFNALNDTSNISKNHVKDIINRFENNYKVPLEELENRYKINIHYPIAIENEMHKFTYDSTNRYDFTNQNTVTIDEEKDKCLDDALYIEQNKDGTYNLFVHIIDIPSFIPLNSSIYKEAIKREETLYLIDCEITMYPKIISNNICSILPGHKRNVITYKITLSPDFDVIDFKILKGVILNKHKLSYDEVDKILENPSTDELSKMLYQLSLFSQHQKNINHIKDKYRKEENEINFNKHHESLRADYSKSANIVQESMILANHLVPKYFAEKNLPYPNRVLHINDITEYEQSFETLKQQTNLNNFSKNYKENLYSRLKPFYLNAKYAVGDYGHDGIGLPYYSHSTSAARRNSDSQGQYIIYDFIFNHNISDKNIHYWEETLTKWCKYFNERKVLNNAFTNQYNYLASKKLIKNK